VGHDDATLRVGGETSHDSFETWREDHLSTADAMDLDRTE